MTEDEFEKLRKEAGLGPTGNSKRAARSGVEEQLRKEQLRKKWEALQTAPPPATPADPATAAKVELLGRLLDVAARTYGAEVWRALFAETRLNLLAGVPPVCEYIPPTDAERARTRELMRGYVGRPHDTPPATEARRGADSAARPAPPADLEGLVLQPGESTPYACPVCGLRVRLSLPAGSPQRKIEHCPACGCAPAGGPNSDPSIGG